jgi:protoporphyrinogen/coproporphyrinogen III oxidase
MTTTRPVKRAIVVGGGAAGASAAFRLKQAGVDVHLVERDGRVGGRTQSDHIDGFIVDLAAGLLPGTYHAVYDLMRDAGQSDALETMSSPTAVMRHGALHYLDMTRPGRSLLRTRLLGLRSKCLLAKVAIKMLGMQNSLGFDNIAGAAPYDTQSIAEYARTSLNAELYDYLVSPIEKMLYAMSGSDASVVDFFWIAKNLMSAKAFCVKGGMGRLVRDVAAHVRVSVDTEVTSVTEVGDEVEVRMLSARAGTSSERVDLCVIATPAREVPKIDRGLAEPSRRYLAGLKYSVLTNLLLRLRERPRETAVLLMVPDSVDPDIGGILMDHHKGSDRVPAGKGAVSIYFMHRWAQKMYAASDEEIYEQGIRKVERVVPGIGALVEGYLVQRWDYAATASYPGYYRELADFAAGLDVKRRVQLAGDYFSMASVNSAVTSGAIAARRLIERYL